MEYKKLLRKGRIFFGIVLLVLLFCAMAYGFSFTSSPAIYSPLGNFTTKSSLVCGFTATGDGTLYGNVTWFKNGVAYVSDDETLSLTSGVAKNTTDVGSIDPYKARKTQVWRCSVMLYNTTSNNGWVNSSSVTIINSQPEVTSPLANQTATEDIQFGPLAAIAFDPDNDPIIWFSSDLNRSLYNNRDLFTIASNGNIVFTPTEIQTGNHSMVLNAYDGSAIGGVVVNWEVVQVNDDPVIQGALYLDCVETMDCAHTFTATDEENNTPLDFSDDTAMFDLFFVDEFSHGFDFVPTFPQVGVHYINITVNDTLGGQSSVIFTLNISTINHPPEVEDNISNMDGTQGNLFTTYIYANDTEINDVILFDVAGENCTLSNPWTWTVLDNGSTNASIMINLTLTNDHIVCRHINVTVRDFNGTIKSSSSKVFSLNLTNVNDAPVINEMSYYEENSLFNNNISEILAPNGLVSYYRINVTDVDSQTDEGENFTFSINYTMDGRITINTTTGLISINPNASYVGNYTISVNVTDDGGLEDSAILSLEVITNYIPQFQNLSNFTCIEGVLCTVYVDALDLDIIGNLSMYTNDSLVELEFYNSSRYILNTTYNQSVIGNYTVRFYVRDNYGAIGTQDVFILIMNKNDAPFFDNDFNNIPDNFTLPYIVVGHRSIIYINVTDFDLGLGFGDYVNFTTNITAGPNTNLFNVTKISNNQGLLDFTPVAGDMGNYTVYIRIDDAFNGSNWTYINFTVYNVSLAPSITHVQPYRNATSSADIFNVLVPVTALASNTTTTVNIYENTSVNFSVLVADPDTDLENITLRWYVDGVRQKSALASDDLDYIHAFDFFSSGLHTIVVDAQDVFYSNVNFTFIVDVTNLNRPPVLREDFPNMNITTSLRVVDDVLKFYDPDDDLDSSGFIDGNETSNLIFTYTTNTFIELETDVHDIIYTPLQTGNLYDFIITVTDTDGLLADSNPFNMTIEYNVEKSQERVDISSGGGGGSSTKAVSVPQPKIVIEYAPLDIIVPKPITIYENDTVKAPIQIVNKGEIDLKEIFISAETNVSNVTIAIVHSYIPFLHPKESQDATIIIGNYRSEGTYEVYVNASVNEPAFTDSAIIYINSVEQGRNDGEAVNTKISFARDLLANNPECIELNEVLAQAQTLIKNGQTEQGLAMIDQVVEGCRYLVVTKTQHKENPTDTTFSLFTGNKYLNTILIGLLVIIVTALVILYIKFKELDKIQA